MFFTVKSAKSRDKHMGSLTINFILSFCKIAILYLLMKTMPANSFNTSKPHVYEVVIRDLGIFILNLRGYLISSYFTYFLTTIWLFVQFYDRVSVIFVISDGLDILKTLYAIISFLRIAYNIFILVVYRSTKYISAFHEFGSDIRLYRKCNCVI